MQTNQRFTIPAKQTLTSHKKKLKKKFPFHEEPIQTIQRVYYDTFDWRIYASGGLFEVESASEGSLRLRWFDLKSHQLLGSVSVAQMPQFIWDFPAGPLRTRLEAILDVRVLLPQITIQSEIHPLKLFNQDEKLTLQLHCEENTLRSLKSKKDCVLGKCLHVKPIRGYEKPMFQVLEAIADLQKMPQSLMEQALTTLEIHPKNFSSKFKIQLTPDLTAEQAIKRVFTNLLQTLNKNEAGLCQDLDSEFLHDFRVAIRRIRSGLGQMKAIFPQKPCTRFRADFAWLGQATSQLRDLDVYLLKLDNYQAALPPELHTDLEPLRTLLHSQKQKEHLKLTKTLASSRYRSLLKDWELFLKQPFFQKKPHQPSQQKVVAVANDRIWRVYQRVLNDGSAIQDETPEEVLHDLRKTCKKLRYLMEFFQSLYPQEEIKSLIKVLKCLQENLGDFQDFQVQWNALMDFGEQLTRQKQSTPNTHMALGMLVRDLNNRQIQARRMFQKHFKEFASQSHQKRFQRLFGKQFRKKKP